MAIAHAGTPTTGTTTGTSLTFSYTVPAGSDRCLIVDVAANDVSATAPAPTGVTFNSIAMTKVDDNAVGGDRGSSMWRLLDAQGLTTITANVVITMTNSSVINGAARTYTGVHQTTPTGTPNGGNGSGNPVTLDVSSATDELVLDSVFIQEGGAAPAVGAGQTERVNFEAAGVEHYLVGSEEAGAATVTMSWTMGGSGAWVSTGAALKPSAGGGGGGTDGWKVLLH